MPPEISPKLKNRLHALRSAFERGRDIDLKKISNDSINEAVLANDALLAEIAVLAYALNKLISKRHVVMHPKWQVAKKSILTNLDKAASALGTGRAGQFAQLLDAAGKDVGSVDMKMGNYVQNLLEKAKVKIASSAYAGGMSLGQSAALTGADRKKLQSYIGFTKIHDEVVIGAGIRERLAKLKTLME
ncbi:MAG: hypothetical protein ABH854_04895 [Candidatus Diapherotrites archaeon]|nr:hypothetical protein [Candidatus Micrarchaeota archaeon]MBU1939347.1 hypothetical protein [Candidatus Micrarchaeota archaeon]